MSVASEMAQRLAREAEAVCRHYLPHGRREGRYWRVGDVHGTPGESLYVRLHGTAAGRWADAATGEHGDLLDLIGLNRRLDRLADVLDEARVFLGSPRAPPELRWQPPAPIGSPEAARRLFARSWPLVGSLAETYLCNRGFTDVRKYGSLRFQPLCWYRDADDRLARGPALIAAVTDLDGSLTGVQRTWLHPSGGGKAPMPSPRRALGHLLGNGVRFGVARDVLAAGEGVETMLALGTALPALPMVAALSAGHLAALRFPPTLRRLYVARDNDAAGRRAAERLGRRAEALGIEALVLVPVLGDFNDDLLAFGQAALRAHLRAQLAPEDVARFWAGRDRLWRVFASADGRRSERADAGSADGRPRLRPSSGRSGGSRVGSATAGSNFLPRPAKPAFLAGQESRPPPSSAAAAAQEGADPSRPPPGDRHKGRGGRGRPSSRRVAAMITDTDAELRHASSPTDHALTELQLYGHRPFEDDPDPRPLPDETAIRATLVDVFDALVSTLTDTRLEPDLADLLWSTVNLFHRAADRVQRELDDNEDAQKRSQREQDGSEVRSVELERLLAEGLTLIERRIAMETFRDHAAELFEVHTGSSWRPRAGSLVSHRTLTASLIDSRDFLAAKRRAETEPLLPAGPRIAFTGGVECNDHHRIWAVLDKVRAKHPDMVLLHGGSPKGAERIAACWAEHRKVTQVLFRPDWARHAKAAPFKRNDRLLEALPIGIVAFPGSGIAANLADKARRLGIPVWRFGDGGA